MTQPPEQLIRFARSAMGLDVSWVPIGTESEQARVWLLSYETEPLAIMKLCPAPEVNEPNASDV